MNHARESPQTPQRDNVMPQSVVMQRVRQSSLLVQTPPSPLTPQRQQTEQIQQTQPTPATRSLRCIIEDLSNILEALETGVVQCETDTINDRMRIGAFETQYARRIIRLKGVQERKECRSLNHKPLYPHSDYIDTEFTHKPPTQVPAELKAQILDSPRAEFIHRDRYKVRASNLTTLNTMTDDGVQLRVLTQQCRHTETPNSKHECRCRVFAAVVDCFAAAKTKQTDNDLVAKS